MNNAINSKREPALRAAISATGVSKSIIGPDGELNILDDINFQVSARQSIAFTGISGSGKSTLLGLLAGLDTPSAGTIDLLGNNLNTLDEDQRAQLRRQRVSFVFQAFHLVGSFTALENVMLALELKGLSKADSLAREMLDRVGLTPRVGHYPRQLSGGEQQRVALARAFCTQPEILFADEPTGNLDSRSAAAIIDLLFSLNDELGTTLVIVTHDQALAERCERELQLDAGRLIDDTP